MSQRHLHHPCGCGAPREGGDLHEVCIICLGESHLRAGMADNPTCPACVAYSPRRRLDRFLLYYRLTEQDTQCVEGLGTSGTLNERPSRSRPRSTPPTTAGRDAGLSQPREHTSPRGRRSAPSASAVTGDSVASHFETHRGVQTVDSSSESSSDSSRNSSPERVRTQLNAPRAPEAAGASGAAADAGTERDDTATAVFTRAAQRLELAMPPIPNTEPGAGLKPMPGERRAVKPRPTLHKFLPVCPGLVGYFQSSWGGQNPPPNLGFKTTIFEGESLGLIPTPSVETRLASTLGSFLKDSPYNVPLDRPPFLTGPAARRASTRANALLSAAATSLSDLNGSGLLLGSLSSLLQSEPTDGDSVDKLISEALRIIELLAGMNGHAVQVIGWLTSIIIKMERERWTEPLAARPDTANIATRLRELPMSSQNLFPGGLELLQAEALEMRERRELVAQVMPPAAPEPSTKPKKSAKKKRTTSVASSSDKQPAPTPPAAAQEAAGEPVPKKWSDTLPPADKGKGRGREKRK